MNNVLSSLAVAAAFVAGTTFSASATTLSIQNAVDTVAWGTGAYSPTGATCTYSNGCYNPSGAAASLTNNLTVFGAGTGYPGLYIDGSATLQITFLGQEAGDQDIEFALGGGSLDNHTSPLNASYTFTQSSAGAANVTFSDLTTGAMAGSGGFSGNAQIAFGGLSADGQSVYAYFDDGGGLPDPDRDYDDMVVKISIVPLPATLFLMFGAFAGLATLRRRKQV